MCKPSIPKIENSVMAKAPEAPEEPPKPVEVSKTSDRTKRKANPLRIDLATNASSGVQV